MCWIGFKPEHMLQKNGWKTIIRDGLRCCSLQQYMCDFLAAGPPPFRNSDVLWHFSLPRVIKGLGFAEREDWSWRISSSVAHTVLLLHKIPACRCESPLFVDLLPPHLHLPSLSVFMLRGKQLLGQTHFRQLFFSQGHFGKII